MGNNNMNLKILMYIILMFVSIAFISCSDLTDEIIENEAPTVHPVGWGTEGSANFHAKSFKDNNWNLK